MDKFSFCQPAKIGAGTGAAVGLTVWLLMSFIPAFHTGVPEPVTAVLPFILGWIGHTGATWIAPHRIPAPAAPALPTPGSGGTVTRTASS